MAAAVVTMATGSGGSALAAEATGRGHAEHVRMCQEEMGFSGTHNPGVTHRGPRLGTRLTPAEVVTGEERLGWVWVARSLSAGISNVAFGSRTGRPAVDSTSRAARQRAP